MTDRIGDWCQTHSGRQLFAWDPRVEDLDIRDIARGLREPRFAGQTIGPSIYTVLQHSVGASLIVPPEHALAALLHDAHECVFRDMPSPIKRHPTMAGYRAGCERFQRVVNAWAGLVPDAHHHPAVKHADMVMLATEARDLMGPPPAPWLPMPEPLTERIAVWSTSAAETAFLERFAALKTTLL